MNDYKKYLAAEILSEGKLVTYRWLSRALKVHVHTAKQMLFEFHESHNSQKPDSVHATYLVYGEKHEDRPSGNEDVEMASSPPSVDAEPLSEPTRALTLTLIQEDRLKDALSLYKTVLSVQVYSLGPHLTKDLQLLSEANPGLSEHSSSITPVDTTKVYGGILNPNMRRKDRKGSRPVFSNTTMKSQPPSQNPMPAKPSVGSQAKNKASESPSSSQGASTLSGDKSSSGGTKARSGGIMQSFAKAASKPKPKPDQASQPAQNSATKAMSIAMVSDDDDGVEDDHSGVLSQPKVSGDGAATRKAREEREAELKRMMEDDDEDEAEENPNSPGEESGEPLPDPEETEAKDAERRDDQGQGDSQPSELVSSSENGRKRGKRKVIKKRQVQDDEGYFVTVRETAWESFSEDEDPQPKKATPAAAPSSGGSAKAKRPAPKGQGSIMSFFGKK